MIIFSKNLKWSKIILNSLLIYLFVFIVLFIYVSYLSKDLPSLDELQKFNPQQVSKIVSSDSVVINKLYTHKRDVVTISKVPKYLRQALLAMEDRAFYEHSGFSIKGILRAIVIDVITMSTRQGASTLTQQLARNIYNNAEFAGLTFDPSGKILFVNIYNPTLTLAISGPWKNIGEIL